MAYDEILKTPTLAAVTNVFQKSWHRLVRVIAGRDTLMATPNHPFYLPGLARYVPADSLRQGMQLLALTGALLTVQSVAALDTTVSVYNFEVAEHHNYYVGAEGVLVHNDCVFVKAGLKSADGVPPADDFDIINQAFLSELGEVQTALARLEIRELLTGANGEALTAFFRGDDLAATLSVVERRAAQVNRVRAWEVLRGDGSEVFEAFTTNTDDLELIADYLKYNPSKQDQLESSFTGAFDKRSFLDDLRESGYQYLPLAEDAFLVYEPKLPEAISTLEGLAGDLGAISGRAKRPESAANRLKRAVDNGWVDANMSVDEAIYNLWDAIGTRVVLNSSDETTLQEVVNRIITASNNGDLDIVRVNSLTGPDGFPYFSQSQLDEISATSSGSVLVQLNDGYESGYTVVTIFVKYSDGIRGEIQIIGSEVLELANAEHLVYDAFLNKPYLNAYPSEIQGQVSAMVEPIRNAAQGLSDSQKVVYENYLNSVYKNARRRELSIPEVPVSLPSGYPSVLDFNYLISIEHAIHQL